MDNFIKNGDPNTYHNLDCVPYSSNDRFVKEFNVTSDKPHFKVNRFQVKN